MSQGHSPPFLIGTLQGLSHTKYHMRICLDRIRKIKNSRRYSNSGPFEYEYQPINSEVWPRNFVIQPSYLVQTRSICDTFKSGYCRIQTTRLSCARTRLSHDNSTTNQPPTFLLKIERPGAPHSLPTTDLVFKLSKPSAPPTSLN